MLILKLTLLRISLLKILQEVFIWMHNFEDKFSLKQNFILIFQ